VVSETKLGKLKMKTRGLGFVFRRGNIWWIQYNFRGQRYRESVGSSVRSDAVKLLQRRMAEIGSGRLHGPDVEKTTFPDLVQMIRDDYAINQRRSVKRLNTSLRALEPAFGRLRACDITLDRLNRYVADRLARGIAPATAKLDMTYLHKMFRLAERAGRAIVPPFPLISVQNARKGFFERSDFESVRSHLPEAYRGVATFAYLSGWRVPSEVLTLRWSQVDFQAGMVRLEPGTTKNDEGRTLPFNALPELAHLLRSQWDHAVSLELETGQAVPWVFFWNDRRTIKPIHIKAFYRRWQTACTLAGVPQRIPHDFRRTAVRNFERAGVPRSVAMKLTGHKTEAVYRRYAIVCEADLMEGVKKLAKLQPDFSHSSATIQAQNAKFAGNNLAEGARFELADRLPHLRFSRPARSAAPSPLHTRP
jgi:integrase